MMRWPLPVVPSLQFVLGYPRVSDARQL